LTPGVRWSSPVNLSAALSWHSSRNCRRAAPASRLAPRLIIGRAKLQAHGHAEQQGCLMLHRTRRLFVRQQTAVINVIRAHLAAFGIAAAVGCLGVERLLQVVANTSGKRLPEVARSCCSRRPAADVEGSNPELRPPDHGLAPIQYDEPAARRDPGRWSGPTARVASVADPKAFRSGRDFSARSGLCQSKTRAEVRTSSGLLANKAMTICAAC